MGPSSDHQDFELNSPVGLPTKKTNISKQLTNCCHIIIIFLDVQKIFYFP